MTATTSIAHNVEAIQERIYAAARQSGRSIDDVILVAVSKTMPPDLVAQAMQAGVLHFGENRVEEAEAKMPQVATLAGQSPIWHMIGHIQSRKAKEVAQIGFSTIHSVDSLKLAKRLDQFAGEVGRMLPILLEVNISGEESKSGWQLQRWNAEREVQAQFWKEVETILTLPHLHVEGLMTMAPYEADPESTRPVFQALAQLRSALQGSFGQLPWAHLSMGMSNDFEVAIQEGATLVRVGRAIFGER